MSINAPASFTITGDAAITITVTWSTNPAGSTISNASFTKGTVNATTYNMLDVFDNPGRLIQDIQNVMTGTDAGSFAMAERLVTALQSIVAFYQLQAVNSATFRFNLARSTVGRWRFTPSRRPRRPMRQYLNDAADFRDWNKYPREGPFEAQGHERRAQ